MSWLRILIIKGVDMKVLLNIQIAKSDNTDDLIICQHYPQINYVVAKGEAERIILKLFEDAEKALEESKNQTIGAAGCIGGYPLTSYSDQLAKQVAARSY